MILNGIEEIQKLLPSVNLRLDSTRLDDFMNRAQQWVSDEIIGSDLEDLLEIEVSGSDPHEALRLRVKRVIATKAYLLFADEMNLQLSEAGMVVQQNQDMVAASSQRRDNLMQSLKSRLDEDCDALVGYLLKNSRPDQTYSEWRTSEQFDYLTLAFLPTMKLLKQSGTQNANLHWSDFHDGISNMANDMMLTSASYTTTAQIVVLRDKYRTNALREVEREVVNQLQRCAAACMNGNKAWAVQCAINARALMLLNLDVFTIFANSDCVTLPGPDFNAGHIVDTL